MLYHFKLRKKSKQLGMMAMSDLRRIRIPTENFLKFSPYCVLLRHFQIMENSVTGALFIEFPNLHFHLDPVLDSVYIAGSCRFHFYFFFSRDFVDPLTHPLFDPTAPYIAIPIYMALPFPPPTAAAAPTASPQQVPSISFSEEEDPSEAASSSSSSFAPGAYTAADASMANGFLSSESI